IGLLFTYTLENRYYILYVPFMCIWATVGIALFTDWTRATWLGLRLGQVDRVGMIAGAFAVLAILLPAASVALSHVAEQKAERQVKQLMQDLAANVTGPLRIAAAWTPPAFHAHAAFVWLPYCDSATARRFLTKSQVTHVVLRDSDLDATYMTKWMEG